jgi:hypothetical protein
MARVKQVRPPKRVTYILLAWWKMTPRLEVLNLFARVWYPQPMRVRGPAILYLNTCNSGPNNLAMNLISSIRLIYSRLLCSKSESVNDCRATSRDPQAYRGRDGASLQ